MSSKVTTYAVFLAAILLAIVDTAQSDDPAYYKLTELEELTIYKEGETELRPTFSFETVAFGQINPGLADGIQPPNGSVECLSLLKVQPGNQGTDQHRKRNYPPNPLLRVS